MVKENIGLALVGCGQIATAHMRAIAALENAQLVFTVDADLDRAREAADAFGALYGAVSYEEVLASDAVDAVVLCLPHDLHLPFTLQAAQAGKHILVEKPMALDEQEARQMAKMAASAKVQLSVGHSTRCMAPYRRAKVLMQEGALGRIVNVVHQRLFWVERLSTDWRRSAASCGGLYLPLFGSHDVDAMLWLLDDTPQSVWGTVRATTDLSDGDSDGFIGLEFADGKVASIAFALRSRLHREEMILVGERATLTIRRNQLLLDDDEIELGETENPFLGQMRAFVEALAQGQDVPVSGEEVIRVMRILDLVRLASESGQAQAF